MSRRALVTASGLVGALAIAGLAAWLLTEPATADAAASRAQATNGSPTPSASPAPASPTTATPTSAAPATPTPAPAQSPATVHARPGSQPQPAAQQQPQPSMQGQQAFIDPATGQLRPAEHDDAAALRAASATLGARRLARTFAEPQALELPDGSAVADVPEELHTFSVATRMPDGRVVFEHASGPTQAKALVRARSATKTQNGQGKEARDDR